MADTGPSQSRTREVDLMQKRDDDLSEVMAEESTRGKKRPVYSVNLELKHRIERAAAMLENNHCDKRRYMALIRDDFGLEDGSPEFQQYMKAWDDLRGR